MAIADQVARQPGPEATAVAGAPGHRRLARHTHETLFGNDHPVAAVNIESAVQAGRQRTLWVLGLGGASILLLFSVINYLRFPMPEMKSIPMVNLAIGSIWWSASRYVKTRDWDQQAYQLLAGALVILAMGNVMFVYQVVLEERQGALAATIVVLTGALGFSLRWLASVVSIMTLMWVGTALSISSVELIASWPYICAALLLGILVSRIRASGDRQLSAALESLHRREESYRGIVEGTPDLIQSVNLDGNLRFVNGSWLEALGYQRHDMPRLAWQDVVHPSDKPTVEGILEATARGDVPERVEMRLVGRNGRLIEAEGVPALIMKGQEPDGLRLILRDITAQKLMDRARRESEEQMRIFVENTPAAVAMFDRNARLITASARWKQTLNLGDTDASGESFYDLLPDHRGLWESVHHKVLDLGHVEACDEDSLTLNDGRLEWVRWEERPWRCPNGEIKGFILLLDLVTQVRAEREALRLLANHDALTGLLNRQAITERVERAHRRLCGGGPSYALLFLDLDSFKPINDTYGHEVGDTVLSKVSERLQRVCRPTDAIARFGGDEFVVLLEQTDREQAERVASRVRVALERPITGSFGELKAHASVGVAVASPDEEYEAVLGRADQAMYLQKRRIRRGA